MTTNATGIVAIEDPSTVGALHILRRQVRGLRFGMWLWLFCLVVAFAAVFALRSVPMVWRSALFALAALPLLALLAQTTRLLWVCRSLGRGERLLGEQAWRPVPARVLTWGRSPVLELTGVGCVRLRSRATCTLRTVELTGQVDVVGPDRSGFTIFRMLDTASLLAGRRTDAVPATVAPPTVTPPGSAVHPVLEHCAPRLRRVSLEGMAYYALCVLFGSALAVTAWFAKPEWTVVALGLATLTVGAVAVVSHLPKLLLDLRLPAQLRASAWSAFPAWLGAWEPGSSTVTGFLDLPDGRTAWFELRDADYDLLVAITMSGVLYAVGTPEAGKTLPVGVPERPILGYARFTAVGVRR